MGIHRRVYLRERMKLFASLLVLSSAQNEQEIVRSTGLASRARPGPGDLAPGPLPSDNARNNLASPGQVALASLHNTAQVDAEFATDDGKARPSSSWKPTGQSGQNSPTFGNNQPNNSGGNYNNKPSNNNSNYDNQPNNNNNNNQPNDSGCNYNKPSNNNNNNQPYNQQTNRPGNSNYNQQQNKPTN